MDAPRVAPTLNDMAETSQEDTSPLGGGGRRKRRRSQSPPISINVGPATATSSTTHSTVDSNDDNADVNINTASDRLLPLNGVFPATGGQTVAFAHSSGQSTSSRELRRHWNRHWHTTPQNTDDSGVENLHQSGRAAATIKTASDSAIHVYRHLQSADHSNTSGIGKQPHVLQVACLFFPILAGAFWYWTKRRARKVATVLGHDSACATAAAATAGSGGTGVPEEGHYRRWYDDPAHADNNVYGNDDEVDEYCAWYAGHPNSSNSGASLWNPDGSYSLGSGREKNSFGAGNAVGSTLEETAGHRQLEPNSVLWIKGGPRSKPRVAGDIELARASQPSTTRTAAEEAAWQPIEDLYALDIMGGDGLEFSPSGHTDDEASCLARSAALSSACSIVSSSIAGIHMPRFAPMTMDRGDHLRTTCRSATPSPAGGSGGAASNSPSD